MSNNINVVTENLKNLKWSNECLSITDFLEKYGLPQMVQVEDGIYGLTDDDTFSSGQTLKIHKVEKERRILCYDKYRKEVHVPFNSSDRIILRRKDYDVYESVGDLARAATKPKFVEIMYGYSVDNEHNDSSYDLLLEEGDILEVLYEEFGSPFSRNQMNFRNNEGYKITLPYQWECGLRPWVDSQQCVLSDMITSDDPTDYVYSFHFEFVSNAEGKRELGILQCDSVYDEDLVIASSQNEISHVVHMIPQHLELTLRVAEGAVKDDPEYVNICRSFHDIEDIVNNFSESRKSQIFQTSATISEYEFNYDEMKCSQSYNEKDVDDDYIEHPVPKRATKPAPHGTTLKGVRKENEYATVQRENPKPPVPSRATKPVAKVEDAVKDFRNQAKNKTPKEALKMTVSEIQQNKHFVKRVVQNISNQHRSSTLGTVSKPHSSIHEELSQKLSRQKSRSESNAECTYENLLTNVVLKKSKSSPPLPNNIPEGSSCDTNSVEAIAHATGRIVSSSSIDSDVFVEEEEKAAIASNQTRQSSYSNTSSQTDSTSSVVANMSVEELCDGLRSITLQKHVETFQSNLIDGRLLCELATEDLIELGLKRFEVKKLFLFKQGWTPKKT